MSIATSDEAIKRVLEAEKEARQEIDLCRHEAELIISNSRDRDRARRIMNRADKHISKVQSIADRMTEQTLADININTSLLSGQADLNERKRADVDKAIELLNAELIGVKHEL